MAVMRNQRGANKQREDRKARICKLVPFTIFGTRFLNFNKKISFFGLVGFNHLLGGDASSIEVSGSNNNRNQWIF